MLIWIGKLEIAYLCSEHQAPAHGCRYREKIATLKSESSELRTRLETVAHQLLLSIGGATAM